MQHMNVGYYAPHSPNMSKLCATCLSFEFPISARPQTSTLGTPLVGCQSKTPTKRASCASRRTSLNSPPPLSRWEGTCAGVCWSPLPPPLGRASRTGEGALVMGGSWRHAGRWPADRRRHC
jgi:hypothetical protein